MKQAETFSYLNKLLEIYDRKLKRFRFSMILLIVGTMSFFFLIFFPYMTLVGNRESCKIQQQQCTQLEESVLDNRFTEVTTNWGNIPISTAEVATLFPVVIAVGFTAAITQLQGLMRLRRAISQQAKTLNSEIDVTLIAPLLLDPKQGVIDQLSSSLILLFPIVVFSYSVSLIVYRLSVLKSNLPYSQSTEFYLLLYFLSACLGIYSLTKISFNFWKEKALEKDNQ